MVSPNIATLKSNHKGRRTHWKYNHINSHQDIDGEGFRFFEKKREEWTKCPHPPNGYPYHTASDMTCQYDWYKAQPDNHPYAPPIPLQS